MAEVVADRSFFDRSADDSADNDSVSFPTDAVPRLVTLIGIRSLIGRRSRSRGIFPEIDMSVPPEDLGSSRTHAVLDHPADGSLAVTDLGSANGTWIGDDLKRLVRGVTVQLGDGASIYLGYWTRITFRRR
jgi:hypothetical protein